MTAEVAVMNSQAVALAADSAATLRPEKILSANKLFTLSKYEPVGIMIYGNASFMGIPWETIVKTFRRDLGTRKFDTLQEYAREFIAFLDNNEALCDTKREQEHVREQTYRYFSYMWNIIRQRCDRTIRERGDITEAEVIRITAVVVREHRKYWDEADFLHGLSTNYTQAVITKYQDVIDQAMKMAFKQRPISARLRDSLRVIGASLFAKAPFRLGYSGVVVAGFGTKDLFPALLGFDIQGKVNRVLKFKQRQEHDCANGPAIIPFAQDEMVCTFMEGIDPEQEEFVYANLSSFLVEYPRVILDGIRGIDNREKKRVETALSRLTPKLLDEWRKKMERYKLEHHVSPIVRIVGELPKDDLADMAEALVSLTSFKRKVTPTAETVGGAIDVAVISKGDGFIWIKRKHYFRSDLNHQFFANYFREAEDDEEQDT